MRDAVPRVDWQPHGDQAATLALSRAHEAVVSVHAGSRRLVSVRIGENGSATPARTEDPEIHKLKV